MQSPFSARRKARKVGQDDDGAAADVNVDIDPDGTSPTVRPSLVARGASSKPKKRSSLRTSFGPGATSMNDDEDGGEIPAVFIPKRSNLSRQAIESNAARKSGALSIDQTIIQNYDDRPSYSADVLNELKASTPSTPKDLAGNPDVPPEGQELDLAAKFGSDLALQQNAAIPTDVEIKEKKERRARLAKEQEYISLNSDGEAEDRDEEGTESDASSNHDASIMPYSGAKRLKEPPSRLAQDDDEVGEGFDDFVSDGRMALGKKAEREQRRRQKADMKAMIEDAEGSDDSSEDESEVERRAAYEAAQTRKGMDGMKKQYEGPKPKRPRTPPRITPLPTLPGVLERLKEQKQGMEHEAKIQQAKMEINRRELAAIEFRKAEVQKLMTEAGERFEKLRAEVEAENASGGVGDRPMVVAEKPGLGMASDMRGLESYGQ
ncbi:MAG: hypothetical protein OHK93_007485 [Ramalina farinacea]|uniref:Nineteen complex-related protein 2-domain-containing protein n=1 Tax=Ramalina farinacea TaxID=258253 RepID=A0AA43QKK3_9LECA|nr:hypothetical protein [Ramalina farinacea]